MATETTNIHNEYIYKYLFPFEVIYNKNTKNMMFINIPISISGNGINYNVFHVKTRCKIHDGETH